ncbi:amino acid deaminase [Microbacterium testaceum]|uniref:amino acid deaminase n=1 Tax=Microbacterium testaceum TaxID=2033 RepID=UPI000CCE2A03|nr:amino acid deaminase [Microbacterium testaceum]PNW10387.1 amino acid deaminase [Microbacterium testaceum]
MTSSAALDAAALDAAAARALSDPAAAISSLPWLSTALADDAAAGRFAAWGRSSVIDENVAAAVLARPLFDELHARAGLEASWPVGNAGVLHVYGYLLSTTPTPYGLKRERWLTGELERACGLDAGAFVPWAGTQTLLSRATAAATVLLARPDALTEEAEGRTARIALGAPLPEGTAALAYAVDGLLVTMFPVADPAALRAGLGAPRLRWNAV